MGHGTFPQHFLIAQVGSTEKKRFILVDSFLKVYSHIITRDCAVKTEAAYYYALRVKQTNSVQTKQKPISFSTFIKT